MLTVAALSITATEASAQFDLSRALNSLLAQPEPQAQTKSPYDILAETAPKHSKITGIWLYDSVGVEYLGINPLADVALQQIEAYALAELRGAGVLPGFFGLTLRRSGVAYLSYEDDIFEGRYDYSEEDASLKISTTVDGMPMSLKGYLKMVNGLLVVMIDANDAMDLFLRLYPEYKTNQTVISAQSTLKSFGDTYISIKHRR